MPQVVACSGCRQRFMAADHLLGTVVACPSCGATLAIPALPLAAPQPAARPLAAAGLHQQATSRPHHDPARRERLICLGIVAAASTLWLLFLLPNVLLWAVDRPAAAPEKVGAGAVIFWVGVVLACGAIFEWSLFVHSRNMRITRQWFGERGAKWFYAGLGSIASLVGLGITISCAAYSLFGTSIESHERPAFAGQPLGVPPAAGPQVSHPPPPPAPPSTAGVAAPPPPPAVAAAQQAGADAGGAVSGEAAADATNDWPGEWRYLPGGFCIKIPSAVVVRDDQLHTQEGETRQHIHGSTLPGKAENVSFSVTAQIDPRRHELDTKAMFELMRKQQSSKDAAMDLILVNGLPVMRTIERKLQAFGPSRQMRESYSTSYLFAEQQCQVTLSVRSRLPHDHPEQQALVAYLNTFQRMPKGTGETAASSAEGSGVTDDWQPLQGGFRIRKSAAMLVRLNEISRHGSDERESQHLWIGKTADGVEFHVDVKYHPAWNHANEAQKIAAARSERPRPDYEHVAIDVNGLVMERIARMPQPGRAGWTTVEYKYEEAQYQIYMKASSELPLDHPSFQTVLGCFESLERLPAP